MARVTVEDCVTQIPNRFDLVMLAARRARHLASGSAPTLERDRDKNPVLALREIAESTISLEDINESLIQSHQKHFEKATEGEEEEFLADPEKAEEWSNAARMSFAQIAEEDEALLAMQTEGEDVSFDDSLDDEEDAEEDQESEKE